MEEIELKIAGYKIEIKTKKGFCDFAKPFFKPIRTINTVEY